MKSTTKRHSSKIWIARFWAPVHQHRDDRFSYCTGSTRIGVYTDEKLAYLQATRWLVRSWFGGRTFLLRSRYAKHVRAFRKQLDKDHYIEALVAWHALMEELTDDEDYNEIHVESTYMDIDFLYSTQTTKDSPFQELDHGPLVTK
jgi:hypothetical protein